MIFMPKISISVHISKYWDGIITNYFSYFNSCAIVREWR